MIHQKWHQGRGTTLKEVQKHEERAPKSSRPLRKKPSAKQYKRKGGSIHQKRHQEKGITQKNLKNTRKSTRKAKIARKNTISNITDKEKGGVLFTRNNIKGEKK